MIELSQKAVYFGPNPYSREPVVVADLQLRDGIAEKCAGVISFIERVHSSWFSRSQTDSGVSDSERIVSFILDWSLSALNYVHGRLNNAGFRPAAENAFCVWLEFHEPDVSFAALELAARQCSAAASGQANSTEMVSQLQSLWRICSARHPGKQALIQIEAARANRIPYAKAWGARNHWQFGWGAKSMVTVSSGSNRDGFVAGQFVANKDASKVLIEQLALPAPAHVLIASEDDIARATDEIGFPCVVKPIDQGGGRGVTAGLTDIQHVRTAFAHARKFSQGAVMLEQFVAGRDHRLMCHDGRFIAAIRRDLPAIVGDGVRSVRELTEELNRGRVLPGADSPTRYIMVRFDEFVLQELARQGTHPDTVLAAGQQILLRSNSNMATGGSVADVTADVHPAVRNAAEALAQTLQVSLAGFDYITTDVSKNWNEVPGAFVELNIFPGLEALTLVGQPSTEVGALLVGKESRRIPLDCIVVAKEEREAVESRLSELISDAANGWASHDKAQIGSVPLGVRPYHPWAGVRSLLANRLIQRAFVLISSSHLREYGFPVDEANRIWCCDEALPREWQDVLGSATTASVRYGSWLDCLEQMNDSLVT